jgi:hypothetical protein
MARAGALALLVLGFLQPLFAQSEEKRPQVKRVRRRYKMCGAAGVTVGLEEM